MAPPCPCHGAGPGAQASETISPGIAEEGASSSRPRRRCRGQVLAIPACTSVLLLLLVAPAEGLDQRNRASKVSKIMTFGGLSDFLWNSPSSSGGDSGAGGEGVAGHREGQCGHIKMCGCIDRTPCGWCKSSGVARIERQKCKAKDWILDHNQCPILACATSWKDYARVSLHAFSPAIFVFLFWLTIRVWRWMYDLRKQDTNFREVDDFSRTVGFVGGKAVTRLETSRDVSSAPAEANNFLGKVRTFEAFRQGLDCPEEERLPLPSRPYCLNAAVLSMREDEKVFAKVRVPRFRYFAFLRISMQFRTALARNLNMIFTLMTISALFKGFFSMSAALMHQNSYLQMAGILKTSGSLISAMQLSVSVLMSFYALNRIQWYWEVMRLGWAMQGRIHDLGMLYGPAMGREEQDLRVLYTLYRHTMLHFFFVMQPFTPCLSFTGFAPLEACGLLMKDETVHLERSHSSPVAIIEGWLSAWTQLHIKSLAVRKIALENLRDMRENSHALLALMMQAAPVSFDSILLLSTYCLCLILPFRPPPGLNLEDRPSMTHTYHITEVLGTGVLIAFYLSMFSLIRHLHAPYDNIGMPHDCLNPLACMLGSEKKLRDYLLIPTTPYLEGTADVYPVT